MTDHFKKLNAGQQAQLAHLRQHMAELEIENKELKETVTDLMGHLQAEEAIKQSSTETQKELAEGSLELQQKKKKKNARR